MGRKSKYQITFAAIPEETITVTVFDTDNEASCQSEARGVAKAQEGWRNRHHFPKTTEINEIC